jgi:hypothetical protein
MFAFILDRLRRSWQLTKASFAVLRSDPELLIFPLVAGLASLLTFTIYALPISLLAAARNIASASGQGNFVQSALLLLAVFLMYVTLYSITIFFNTALMGAAMKRLDGGNPTLQDGITVARSHLKAILGYAVIAASVGMVLQALQEGARESKNPVVAILGQLITSGMSFAWGLLTFFVVPILIVEKVGPIEAIKRSGALLRKTWGEQIVGAGGISFVFSLIFMVVMFGLGIPTFFIIISSRSGALALILVVILVLILMAIALFGGALSAIYQAALYRYATNQENSGAFSDEMLKGAFAPKS